jgi:hypothetical protein
METQDWRISFNNAILALSEAIPKFIPEQDNKYYRGRQMTLTGWCDIYVVTTFTKVQSSSLIGKLQKHYLSDADTRFMNVMVEIGTNGCLTARFYVAVREERSNREKVSADHDFLSFIVHRLEHGGNWDYPHLNEKRTINISWFQDYFKGYHPGPGVGSMIGEYCINNGWTNINTDFHHDENGKLCGVTICLWNTPSADNAEPSDGSAHYLTKLQRYEIDTAKELIGVISTNIPSDGCKFSERHIKTPAKHRIISRAVTKAIESFFYETKGVGITISRNTNTDMFNIYISRHKEFTAVETKDKELVNEKKPNASMKPTFMLMEVVNTIIPKIDGSFIDGPFEEVSTTVPIDTTELNGAVVEGVVAFYLARFNIVATISVDYRCGIVTIHARRNPVMPIRMPTEDRFFYEIIECMDAKIDHLRRNNSDVWTMRAVFDMKFFWGYMPSSRVEESIQAALVRKYSMDGWTDVTVNFDNPAGFTESSLRVTLTMKPGASTLTEDNAGVKVAKLLDATKVAEELIALIDTAIPDANEPFSQKCIRIPLAGDAVDESVIGTVMDFFRVARGVDIHIVVNFDFGIVNIYLARLNRFVNKDEPPVPEKTNEQLKITIANQVPDIDTSIDSAMNKIDMLRAQIKKTDSTLLIEYIYSKISTITMNVLVYNDLGAYTTPDDIDNVTGKLAWILESNTDEETRIILRANIDKLISLLVATIV